MPPLNFADLPNRFDFSEAEPRLLQMWDSRGYNQGNPDDRPRDRRYSLVIPPPNVTGALHLGHALNNSLQDILSRWKRMQGFNTLWMPGTDHAGIATQATVEKRLLADEKKTRRDLGREALVERIWKWKEEYEARILGQLKRIGASCDWKRTRFTLDPICARAVRETFFRMFRDRYIFRGKRLVNWDAKLQTSVADDETYAEDTKGGFWTFKYPVVGRPGEFIRFSTTRPETMLGDTAVCVHPSDERYKSLIGQKVLIPLVQREIPIIADGQLADPTLGTGCVKVTPAHDPNDYACWQRNPQIGIINILNPDGTINENGGKFAGLDRYKAREAVVAEMETLGLFEGREDRVIPLKYSDRSKTPIEPYLSDQWFVKMSDRDDGKQGLAQMAMDAVTSGRVKIFPERYAKSYLDWLGEKRDWCISRQLWWGHRIPVWSRTLKLSAAMEDPVLADLLEWPQPGSGTWSGSILKRKYQDFAADLTSINYDADELTMLISVADGREAFENQLEQQASFSQDPDVLDTWFSSALWPHSTLGWPDSANHPEIDYYYPTSTLVTSRDIITLWVARMVITGLYNVGDVPFREVFIHPKILDGYGETMSKTKGNGVDPLDVIDKFGPDALRFGLAHLTTETQDVRMPVQFECPNCQSLIDQTKKNRELPKVVCPKCEKLFSTQWARDPADKALPRGPVVSERFEVSRNFVNKLWNAARLALMNLGEYKPAQIVDSELTVEDRWILSRLATVTQGVTESLGKYMFAEAARALYDFTWGEFCDFFAEMVKPRLADPVRRPLAQRVLAHTLDTLLRLLHPIMPFVTEEIWQLLNQAAPLRGLPVPLPAGESVMMAPWPAVDSARQDKGIEARFAQFQEVLGALREIRSRQNIISKSTIEFSVICDSESAERLQLMQGYFLSMANAKSVGWGAHAPIPETGAKVSITGAEVHVDLKDFIDVEAELTRLCKEEEKIGKLIGGKEAKLSQASFVEKAPKEVVEKERQQLAQYQQQRTDLQGAIDRLRKLGGK